MLYSAHMESAVPVECVGCGQAFDASGAERCPRCSEAISDADRQSIHRAIAVSNGRQSRILRISVGWVSVVLVYSAGAGFLMGSTARPDVYGFSGETFAVSLVVLTVAIVASLGAGWIATVGYRDSEKHAAFQVWRRQVWVLQLPWLVMAPSAIAMTLCWLMLRRAGGYRFIFDLPVLLALLWMISSIGTLFAWRSRTRTELIRTAIDPPGLRLRFMIAAIIVLSGAILLGFTGGMVATMGSWELAGIDWFPSPD